MGITLLANHGGASEAFGVTPNGEGFLIAVPADRAAIQSLVVVANWPAALKQ